MKEQFVDQYDDLDAIEWWEFTDDQQELQEPARHVSTLYSMCKHASLQSLRDQSTNTTRFFSAQEIAELDRHIGYRQERLLDLRAYMQDGLQHCGTKRTFKQI